MGPAILTEGAEGLHYFAYHKQRRSRVSSAVFSCERKQQQRYIFLLLFRRGEK